MMIQSNYEINVARLFKKPLDREPRYYHYCKIELGNVMPDDASKKLQELKELFSGDYKLTMYKVDCYAKEIEL